MGGGSLIVFFQILPNRAHGFAELLVELQGRINTDELQEVVHGHDLRDHRDVLPGVQRDRHLGEGHTQDLRVLPFQAGPAIHPGIVPGLELNHDLDSLLLPDGPDSKQRADIDNPDASDFHMMPLELQR